jgi:hypothetical protein
VCGCARWTFGRRGGRARRAPSVPAGRAAAHSAKVNRADSNRGEHFEWVRMRLGGPADRRQESKTKTNEALGEDAPPTQPSREHDRRPQAGAPAPNRPRHTSARRRSPELVVVHALLTVAIYIIMIEGLGKGVKYSLFVANAIIFVSRKRPLGRRACGSRLA